MTKQRNFRKIKAASEVGRNKPKCRIHRTEEAKANITLGEGVRESKVLEGDKAKIFRYGEGRER